MATTTEGLVDVESVPIDSNSNMDEAPVLVDVHITASDGAPMTTTITVLKVIIFIISGVVCVIIYVDHCCPSLLDTPTESIVSNSTEMTIFVNQVVEQNAIVSHGLTASLIEYASLPIHITVINILLDFIKQHSFIDHSAILLSVINSFDLRTGTLQNMDETALIIIATSR